MSTTAEKMMEATRTLPEPLLAEVLDFAEFLRLRRGGHEHAASTLRLFELCGGLEGSATFAVDPIAIQRQLRDEWQ
jgi:hypothetical protein